MKSDLDAFTKSAIHKIGSSTLFQGWTNRVIVRRISERRARAVAEALAGAGLPAPAFDIEAAGADGAVVGGVNDPLRRRTEVLIEVVAPR